MVYYSEPSRSRANLLLVRRRSDHHAKCIPKFTKSEEEMIPESREQAVGMDLVVVGLNFRSGPIVVGVANFQNCQEKKVIWLQLSFDQLSIHYTLLTFLPKRILKATPNTFEHQPTLYQRTRRKFTAN